MLSTNMLPTPARSKKPCKRATSTQSSKTNLNKMLCFPPHGSPPNEQNFSVISASTPCISESQGASDVSGIVGELELVTKGVGTITHFQDEPQPAKQYQCNLHTLQESMMYVHLQVWKDLRFLKQFLIC